MKILFRKARITDLSQILGVELKSFGGNLIDDEYKLIFERNWGDVFVTEMQDRIVAYLVILYKGYDENVERQLQPIIAERKAQGKRIFHDDVSFDATKYVYFHLLGVLPEYQSKGIGRKLMKYGVNNLAKEHKHKRIKAIIRINNVASVKMCWKAMGLCATAIKKAPSKIFGSQETNFYLESGLNGVKLTDNEIADLYVMKNKQIPDQKSFLFQIDSGMEDDIQSGLKEQMEKTFSAGFILDGVYKKENQSKSYYLFRK